MSKCNEKLSRAKKAAYTRKTDVKSPGSAKTAPLSDSPLPDANVDTDEQCILTDTPEQVRPDTGSPCHDGRDAE